MAAEAVFKHWPEIENSYRRKFVDDFLARCPELEYETYVITEKINGSNLQWFFRPHEAVMAGSRNNFLSLSDSFQGVRISDLLGAHYEVLDSVQGLADRLNITVRLFGELFGPGIQKGVRYGGEKRVLYFGIMLNDILMPFRELERFIPPMHLVPIVAIVEGLENAVEFDTRFDSLVMREPNNICEGVVMQPYTVVYFDTHGDPFLLKKKNAEFLEKQRAEKPAVVDSEVERLRSEFASYITDNRLQSVFSKYGKIETPSQIGDYIRWMLADAKEEFLKDFGADLAALDGAKQKSVYNVGSQIVDMLKSYL